MSYYSKKLTNFREFVEDTSSGAFTTDKLDASSFDGRTHPQVTLDFPTVTKHGEVIGVYDKGVNHEIQINGGITVIIPRTIYRKKYNRLPRARRKDKDGNTVPGDIVTAVFYKYKEKDKLNYSLKGFSLDRVR